MADPVASPPAIADVIGSNSGARISVTLGGVVAMLFVLNYLMTPKLDQREPPLLKPTIPWIGHIVNIITHQTEYHTMLRAKYPMPIASLQMLWGKVYAIWDPFLSQAALKSRACSFDAFSMDFAGKVLGLTDESVRGIRETNVFGDFYVGIHDGLRPVHVQEMSSVAGAQIASRLNEIGPSGLDIPNMFLWVREVISMATTKALFGKENPFEKDPSLIDALAVYDANIASFLTRPFPRITNARGVRARDKVRDGLIGLYGPGHDQTDPTVSAICRNRGATLRKYNWPVVDIAASETMLAAAATLNTIPTMFWLLYHILARPELIESLRRELEPRLKRGEDGVVKVDVNVLDKECPLLLSCYRENLRVETAVISMRRVIEDTLISDGHGGSYMLKKGTDVHIAASALRATEQIWGHDAKEFNPERFMAESEKECTNEEARMRKAAYFPFGGGKHLCPGRMFAYAEILATTCMLVVGFEVKPLEGGRFATVEASPPKFSTSVLKPADNAAGYGVRMSRRKGWEDVQWRFEYK